MNDIELIGITQAIIQRTNELYQVVLALDDNYMLPCTLIPINNINTNNIMEYIHTANYVNNTLVNDLVRLSQR
jgi:hypothetical protein